MACAAWLVATAADAKVLWQRPQETLAREGMPSEDILHGAVAARDDTSSGTLYFKVRVDPLSDVVLEVEKRGSYIAGLVLCQGKVEKLGIGNAQDAWGYSAFCPSLRIPGSHPGEVTFKTRNPEAAGANPYRAPRRGVPTTFVVKVDFIPGSEDVVTVWLAPDLTTGSNEASQADDIVTRFKGDASFDGIRLIHRGLGEGWKFDDIAIATSFEDFVPIPWWQRGWVVALLALAGVGLVAAVVIVLERRRAARRLLVMERERAVVAERVRIAQDLHDDLGAKVTEIVLLGELAKAVRGDPSEEPGKMDAILGGLRQLHASLDEAVWSINPRHDSLNDLVEFLSEFAERFLRHAPVEFHLEIARPMPNVELSSTTRHNFLLAVKEALNNAVRHARAATIRLRLGVEDGQLCACVADDGCGIQEATVTAGDGLRNLRARLEAIGGSTTIRSTLGQGTEVIFRLPLPPEKSKVASDMPGA